MTNTDNNTVIIPPPSYSFGITSLMTLALFYAKIEVSLYVKWYYVFLPTKLFFVYKLLAALNLFRTI